MSSQEEISISAFDNVAVSYDKDFTLSNIGKLLFSAILLIIILLYWRKNKFTKLFL